MCHWITDVLDRVRDTMRAGFVIQLESPYSIDILKNSSRDDRTFQRIVLIRL